MKNTLSDETLYDLSKLSVEEILEYMREHGGVANYKENEKLAKIENKGKDVLKSDSYAPLAKIYLESELSPYIIHNIKDFNDEQYFNFQKGYDYFLLLLGYDEVLEENIYCFHSVASGMDMSKKYDKIESWSKKLDYPVYSMK